MRDDIKRLHYKRATRNKVKVGVPSNSEGADGDIIISNTKGSLYLFAKYNNRWYNIKMNEGFPLDTSKK